MVAEAAVMRIASTITSDVSQQPPINLRSWLTVNIAKKSGRIVAHTNDAMQSRWSTTLTTEQN